MSRKNLTDPEEAVGIVLIVSTSLWLPVSRRRVFEFPMREDTRNDWDFLINGGPSRRLFVSPRLRIFGQQNSYSGDNDASFILQETWNDVTSSLLVYTTMRAPILEFAMSGGDSSFVALLPSGFTIFHDGKGGGGGIGDCEFQILVSTDPESTMTIDLVSALTILLSCTIKRIKDAFQIP
ncbi:Homeobox-leucine zipper protein ROC5 [Linum perenne]